MVYSILQSKVNQRVFRGILASKRGEFRVMVYGPSHNFGNAHWIASERLAPFGWNELKAPPSALYAVKVRPKRPEDESAT